MFIKITTVHVFNLLVSQNKAIIADLNSRWRKCTERILWIEVDRSTCVNHTINKVLKTVYSYVVRCDVARSNFLGGAKMWNSFGWPFLNGDFSWLLILSNFAIDLLDDLFLRSTLAVVVTKSIFNHQLVSKNSAGIPHAPPSFTTFVIVLT